MTKKWIEIKKGNKTIYKLVDENYVQEEDFSCSDIAANGGCISFGLTEDEYKRIFNKESKSRLNLEK